MQVRRGMSSPTQTCCHCRTKQQPCMSVTDRLATWNPRICRNSLWFKPLSRTTQPGPCGPSKTLKFIILEMHNWLYGNWSHRLNPSSWRVSCAASKKRSWTNEVVKYLEIVSNACGEAWCAASTISAAMATITLILRNHKKLSNHACFYQIEMRIKTATPPSHCRRPWILHLELWSLFMNHNTLQSKLTHFVTDRLIRLCTCKFLTGEQI